MALKNYCGFVRYDIVKVMTLKETLSEANTLRYLRVKKHNV